MTPVANYITNPQGERIAVVLPIEIYQELLEDMEDLTALVERQNEPVIDHVEVITQLKANGQL